MTSTPPSTVSRPPRIAIVGSGPSGLFTAEELLRKRPGCAVDIYERLHLPFGLVRYGVAPDHPHTRRVAKLLEGILAKPGIRLMADTMVGRDVAVDELLSRYDAVVIACGAEDDRDLNIPGEHLPGVHSSLEFSAWINGHPDYATTHFDFSCAAAAIVGNGNVALDAARLLARSADELRATDIAPVALEALTKNHLREIHIVGRRGPVQSMFGTAELAEVVALNGWHVVVNPAELALNAASGEELGGPDDRPREVMEIFHECASRPAAPIDSRRIVFHFNRRPVELIGTDRLQKIRLEVTRLDGPAWRQKADGTGAIEDIDCGLLIKSVGHHGVPLPGVPFDAKKGIIPNRGGRVSDAGGARPRLYCVGWIKRGPTGLIGHNRRDAMETAGAVLQDLSPAAGG